MCPQNEAFTISETAAHESAKGWEIGFSMLKTFSKMYLNCMRAKSAPGRLPEFALCSKNVRHFYRVYACPAGCPPLDPSFELFTFKTTFAHLCDRDKVPIGLALKDVCEQGMGEALRRYHDSDPEKDDPDKSDVLFVPTWLRSMLFKDTRPRPCRHAPTRPRPLPTCPSAEAQQAGNSADRSPC